MSQADDAGKRGTKRKRYEGPKEKDVGVRISGKLHHALKEARKATKKAKTFETQKLVKKLKSLRGKDGKAMEIENSEVELDLMKRTDHEPIACTALKTKLNKDRILSGNEHVQKAISDGLFSDHLALAAADTPAAKVQSRLLSSKALASEIAMIVEDLKNLLLPKEAGDADADGEEETVERPKKARKNIDKDADGIVVSSKVGDVDKDVHMGVNEHAEDDEEDAEGDGGWESGTVGDDDDKGSDDGWESEPLSKDSVAHINADSGSESEDSEFAGVQVGIPKNKQSETVVSVVAKPTGVASTFLPSLSVGFVRGGSDDSGWSDSEAKIADGDQKKNRRGQRARRAIWEKKYGRNANHKKKEKEETNSLSKDYGRRSGSEAHGRPPSISVDHRKARRNPPSKSQVSWQTDAGWGQRSKETQASSAGPPKRGPMHREERPLHPSWVAKKLMKEKQSAGIVPSQGTKIKFT